MTRNLSYALTTGWLEFHEETLQSFEVLYSYLLLYRSEPHSHCRFRWEAILKKQNFRHGPQNCYYIVDHRGLKPFLSLWWLTTSLVAFYWDLYLEWSLNCFLLRLPGSFSQDARLSFKFIMFLFLKYFLLQMS